MHVSIKNGTNAGWRVIRDKPKDWFCPSCKRKLRYYWTTCPEDNTPRPQ